MDEEKVNSTSNTRHENDLPRPVLVVSKQMAREHSVFLERLLVGLAVESVRALLICPPDCDMRSVSFGIVELVRHPAVDLPFFRKYNRNRLLERLEKYRPTVLHCLCRSRVAFTRKLARQLNLPYVLTVNSLRRGRRQLSISSKRCVRITAPAQSIALGLAKAHPRFSERIEHVNIATFVPNKTNCFSDTGRLTSIVTTAPPKNDRSFENLLEAVRRLAIEGHEFLVVVMDAGAGEKQLRKAVSSRGLSGIVIRVPQIRPSRPVLAAGDIFVRFVTGPAFEPLLLEAMSLGMAVAASRGGVDDLIIEGQTAAVFDPQDKLSIYTCLKELLNVPEASRRIAAAAQKYVRENHSLDDMISSFVRIYRDASAKPNR